MNNALPILSVAVLLLVPRLCSGQADAAAKNGIPPASTTNQAASGPKDTYVITPGDKLSYRVTEDRDEAKILPVFATGEIEVPYLGRMTVAGKTITQSAADIKSLLEKELYFQATVRLTVEEPIARVVAMKPKTITISGSVRAPGQYDMPIGEKCMLSRMILKAGGLTPFANGRKIRIIRMGKDGKTQVIIADVLAVLKDGKIDKDVELMPDDLIIVNDKLLNF